VSLTQMPNRGTAGPTKLTAPSGSIIPDVLRSEWTKLRTVRSTYWTLVAAAVSMIGLSLIVCAVFAAQNAKLSAKTRASFNPVTSSLAGIFLAELAIAVLGVLVITSEYGSGMIRATFSAVPQRLTVLGAKAAVFAGVTLVVTTAGAFIAFFAGQAILSTNGLGVGLGSPGALRTVIGTGLYLAVLGLLALGLGTIIRKTAGAITAVFGILFVLPALASLLPSSTNSIQEFLPSAAGRALIGGSKLTSSTLSPWVGFGVFCLWAAAALSAGGWTLVHRDA
jgi:ABC-2 type transport system permease protein